MSDKLYTDDSVYLRISLSEMERLRKDQRAKDVIRVPLKEEQR